MTDVVSTVKSVERAVASSDHNFSDVYANIVALQQSSGDMRQFQQAMDAANKEIAKRGLNDLNHDGKPDFVLVGAADGMIITGDPSRGMLQARDQHFQVVKERRPDGNQPPQNGAQPHDGQQPPNHRQRRSDDGQTRSNNEQPRSGDGQTQPRSGDGQTQPRSGEGQTDFRPPASPDKPTNTSDGVKTWGDRQFTVKEDGSASYEVKGGDTLWSISQDVLRNKLGREPNNAELMKQIDDIARASNIADPNLIRAGMDVLTIPKDGSGAGVPSDQQEQQQQQRQQQQRGQSTDNRSRSNASDRQGATDDSAQRTDPMKGIEVGGYAFPVVGYTGATVPLHHGSSHGGSDLFAPRGTPVVAFKGGTVEYVGNDPIGGNNVMIRQDDGKEAYYAHLDQTPLVRNGQRVETGQQLGVVGDTGNAKGTGTHLHFGVGNSIITGTGPEGGVGSGFDAVQALNQVLQATRANNQTRA